MPLLASLITQLFGGVAAFFANMASKKVTTMVLATGAIGVVSTALLVIFNTLVSPLVQAMFSTQYGQFLGLAFPPISGTCMATIGTIWTACAAYKLKVASIKMTASA